MLLLIVTMECSSESNSVTGKRSERKQHTGNYADWIITRNLQDGETELPEVKFNQFTMWLFMGQQERGHTHTPAEADDSGKGATTCKKQHPPTNFKRKRADLSSSGSSSMSDSEAVKNDQLSVREGRSKAASRGRRKGGREWRGRRRVGERGRGGAGRGGRGQGRGERGMRNKTVKVTAAKIAGLEFSAGSSSSDSEFDSIVKSLEGEELELLGDYTDHEVVPPVQEEGRVEETVCGKGVITSGSV